MGAFVNKNSKTYFGVRNEFSEMHYDLPNNYGMFDIDVFQGKWMDINIESGKDNATYIEYRCLKYDKNDNRFDVNRFKPIAFFELKFKKTDSVIKQLELPTGSSVWAAFMFSRMTDARFFVVVATNGNKPFHFLEYDDNGKKKYIGALNYETNKRSTAINCFWRDTLKIF